MHQNYYFLKKITKALEPILLGKQLLECYSQKGDEVILSFADEQQEFYIKTILTPGFSALCFPQQQAKPKRFFVNLFKEAIGKKVIGVKQLLNERSFEIILSDGYRIAFQFFGRRSNVLLIHDNDFVASYRKTNIEEAIKKDRLLDQSKEAFIASEGSLNTTFPTLGKKCQLWLKEKGYEGKDVHDKWNLIKELLIILDSEKIYLHEVDGIPELTLLKPSGKHVVENDPLKAITQFVYVYLKTKSEHELRSRIEKKLKTDTVKQKNYISKVDEKLQELTTGTSYREMADVLMANLHQLKQGSSKVTLLNFYTNQKLTIRLKKDLSPQKNAENFYRKAKNQKVEIENLKTNKENKVEQLITLEKKLKEVEGCTNYIELKNWAKANGFLGEEKKKVVEKPFKVFEIDSFTVYVGKSAANNDLLTLKYAQKDDLWLHAKDVSGSHTVIKVPSGKKVPSQTIEKVAAIAAYYSKRKTESLCPVIVTPKKYVRKRKGAPPGQVVVEREEVVLVQPGLPDA